MKGWQKEYFFSASPELAGSSQAVNVLESFLNTSRGAKRPPWPSMEKRDPEGQVGFASLYSTGGSTWKLWAQVLGVIKHIPALQQLLLHLLQVWAWGEGHGKGGWPASAWEGCCCCGWLQVKQGRYYTPWESIPRGIRGIFWEEAQRQNRGWKSVWSTPFRARPGHWAIPALCFLILGFACTIQEFTGVWAWLWRWEVNLFSRKITHCWQKICELGFPRA